MAANAASTAARSRLATLKTSLQERVKAGHVEPAHPEELTELASAVDALAVLIENLQA